MDLDDLLTSAAPATTQRDDALERELTFLIAEAEHAVRRPRRRWRTAVIVAAVGVGATATAASIWRTPPTGSWDSDPVTVVQTFRLPGQAACRVVHEAQPITQPDALKGVSDAEWAKALEESQRFLRNFDPASVDQQVATQDYLRDAEAARAAAEPGQGGPASTLGEAYIGGFTGEIDRRLDADLTAHGLPTGTVALGGGFPMRCLEWDQ